MSGGAAALMSVLMVAALLLTGGGIALIARGQERGKGALMLLCALILVANVLVWTL
jgi:hypothetical protein